MELERFAADQDVRLVRDSLAAVEPERHEAITAYRGRLPYDALLVCVGARPVRALPGAITFRGGRDAAAVRAALDAMQPGDRGHDRVRGPLRRLLDAAALRAGDPRRRAPARARGAGAGRDDVARGRAAGGLRRRRLDRGGAGSSTLAASSSSAGARAIAADAGELELDDGRRIQARAVDHASGPASAGASPDCRQDAAGFIAVDEHGRVPGADGVYAAGDVTTFPLKQGGLATQQADAAAEAMLAALGPAHRAAPVRAGPQGRPLHRPRARLSARHPRRRAARSPARTRCGGRRARSPGATWRPISRSARGAPRAPEVRPEHDAIPVTIDIPRAVHAVSNALDPSAVPPG